MSTLIERALTSRIEELEKEAEELRKNCAYWEKAYLSCGANRVSAELLEDITLVADAILDDSGAMGTDCAKAAQRLRDAHAQDVGRHSPYWIPASKQREERRPEDAGLSLVSEPHVTAPPVPVPLRLNEIQKREFLIANGWTCHSEIEDQNIRVCWERGAQWYNLNDAYSLVLKEREANMLRAAGWVMEVGIDERERWRDTAVLPADDGQYEWLPREWAFDRLTAAISREEDASLLDFRLRSAVS